MSATTFVPMSRRRRFGLLAACLLTATAATAATAAASPAHATALTRATAPQGRTWASFAYDPPLHEAVLFGGDTGYESGPDEALGDTWTWTSAGGWVQQHPATAPSARTGAAMAYDGTTRQLLKKSAILFGGFSLTGLRLGDTWQWKNGNWTQLHPAARPGVVSPAWQAAFDGASQQLVVYGGETQEGFTGDTWAWTGSTWRQLHPAASPGLRSYGSMLYDRDLHKLVLFGGSTQDSDPATTWTWNGTGWRQVG